MSLAAPKPAVTHIYEYYSHLKPVKVGVVKEQSNHVKDKVS